MKNRKGSVKKADGNHYYERGSISEDGLGVWEMALKEYRHDQPEWGDDVDDCYCRGPSCAGRQVPHIFFACPYCHEINAEHCSWTNMVGRMSIMCSHCDKHLWIIAEGFKRSDWDGCFEKDGK